MTTVTKTYRRYVSRHPFWKRETFAAWPREKCATGEVKVLLEYFHETDLGGPFFEDTFFIVEEYALIPDPRAVYR